jgi:hypothetical protein
LTDPWLAVDASTSPFLRARMVREAWESFVDGGSDQPVRQPIADSWMRCQDAGVAYVGSALAPNLADDDEAEAQWLAHPLATAKPLIDECLAPLARESHLVVVSDHRGMLLWVDGDRDVRREAEAMNFSRGTLWSETGAGTNAVGTALAADHAVQVFAAEHFHEVVQNWTCSAAPVHDPETGALLGVIDLTSRMSTIQPHALAVVVATARAVEGQLATAMQQRDARLVDRYGSRVAAGSIPTAMVSPTGRVIARNAAWLMLRPHVRPAPADPGRFVMDEPGTIEVERLRQGAAYLLRVFVRGGPTAGASAAMPDAAPATLRVSLLEAGRPRAEVDGRPVPLRPRQAEILALLVSHPDGMTTEQLGADLYGDDAKPSSVRVEVSRLRKLLGPWITTDPYKLSSEVECDVRTVHDLLESGEVREAADRFGSGLLPRSEAPGVVRERELLGNWLRQAVLASDDPDTLWAWVGVEAGSDDLIAWRQLLLRLSPRDPRRPQAVARTGTLRALLTGGA